MALDFTNFLGKATYDLKVVNTDKIKKVTINDIELNISSALFRVLCSFIKLSKEYNYVPIKEIDKSYPAKTLQRYIKRINDETLNSINKKIIESKYGFGYYFTIDTFDIEE